MRLLLDECLPRQLARLLTGHEARTVGEEGWAGLRNGDLISRAKSREFEVLVTIDGGFRYQQNLEGAGLSVLLLQAPTNRLADLEPLVPAMLDALPELRPGELQTVGRSSV